MYIVNNSKYHISHEYNYTLNLIWLFLSWLYLYLDIHFEWTQTLHHTTNVNKNTWKIHTLIRLKAAIVKSIAWLQGHRRCCASRAWEECYTIRYRGKRRGGPIDPTVVFVSNLQLAETHYRQETVPKNRASDVNYA